MPTPQPESKYPTWLEKRLRAQRQYVDSLRPFPFDQPADITPYLSLHQNDYLRLSKHPEVIAAQLEAGSQPRVSSFSSPVFGGESSHHTRFVEDVARSMQATGALLTTAGWTANVGLIEALANEDMPVYIDSEAHASLADGIRLSAGRPVLARHNDPAHLRKRIRIHGPGIVCVDALYSTDGSVADIAAYAEICEAHDCLFVLDEAHSFGMFGELGGGLAVAQGVASRVHFRTVSLSKALGGHGGLVVGDADVLRSVSAGMRSVLFSSSTSAVLAAAHSAALRVVMREPELAQHTLQMAALLRGYLEDAGYSTSNSASQIISIFFEGEESCQFYGALREKKILTSVFIPPAVPAGMSLARFSVYSELSSEDIEYVARHTIDALRAMNYENWSRR